MVQDDRRAIVGVGPLSGESLAANLDVIFAAGSHHAEADLLATRGEGHVLSRIRLRSEFRTGGPAEYEYLSVGESDGRGRISSNVYFDPGDLDAAYRARSPLRRRRGRAARADPCDAR